MTARWDRIELNFTGEPPGEMLRLVTFLGHHDSRVYLAPWAYIEVGAGSLLAARQVQVRSNLRGCVGRIGRYTEFANCSVFVGADHANDLPVNMSFAKAALHRTGANNTDPGLAPPRPFNIGSGVVVSEYAVIRDGSVIGDGAVIGAGSVLAGEAEPFGIYGGVPARLLRHRMDPERRELAARVRWWDFDAGYLAANMSRIQDLALQDIEHPRMQERPRIIYRRRDDGGFIPTGFAEDGVERPLSDAPAHIQDYVRHATTDAGPPHLWRSDVWAD